ncbi:MAG: polyhydroxybutyrate depolymerase, partial [Nitrospiraceae bacterium]
ADRANDGTRVRRESYRDCSGGAEVILYAVEGGGHTWPGSGFSSPSLGRTSQDISATELINGFFSGHSRM